MYDKPKKKKKPYDRRLRFRWFLVSSIASILMFVGLAVIYPVCGCSPAPELATIEQTLNTALPDSVSNLHYYHTFLPVFFVQTRFDMPHGDIPAFLDSISHMCFVMPLQDNVMPFGSPESKKTWWRPRSATQFMGSQECGDNPYWQLMIDQTNDEVAIVYILGYSR